jgi:hypothetical protein
MALNAYIAQLQDLLHDPNGQNWSTAQLTIYINEARNRVCDDCYALRAQVTGLTTSQGVEQYLVSAIPVPTGYTPVNVMAIDLYWGTERIPLNYAAWRDHSVKYRQWATNQQRPLGFTRMGAQYYYLGPVPDQSYVYDINCSMRPPPLVDDTTVEPIAAPFTDLIQWWAAYKAKFREQSYAEAEMFKKEYFNNRRLVGTSFMNGVVPSVYGR